MIKAVMKIQRHGYDTRNPVGPYPDIPARTNRNDLERELGDLDNALSMMVRSRDISGDAIKQQSYQKAKIIGAYLHHQGPTE